MADTEHLPQSDIWHNLWVFISMHFNVFSPDTIIKINNKKHGKLEK